MHAALCDLEHAGPARSRTASTLALRPMSVEQELVSKHAVRSPLPVAASLELVQGRQQMLTALRPADPVGPERKPGPPSVETRVDSKRGNDPETIRAARSGLGGGFLTDALAGAQPARRDCWPV